MPVTTIHNYIDNYLISPNSTRLIIGTIHPHLIENFNVNFFYGSVGSFWDILSNAFPQRQFGNLDQITETLDNYNVATTDKSAVLEALDSDFKDFEDALKNFSAQKSEEIKIIVTRNIKGYKISLLSIMTPETYLKLMK